MIQSAPTGNADIMLLRFDALCKRGYRSRIVLSTTGSLHSIEFDHPGCSKKRYVPKLALWSDGLLGTNGLLWPEHHVPSERVSPPAWQKCIAPEDAATFDGFAASIALPSFADLQIRPLWRLLQRFAFRTIFGGSLCISLAMPVKLIASSFK